MRSFQLHGHGLDQLKLTQQPVPQPGPHEVLVRLEAASLNYRDVMLVNGPFYREIPMPLVPVADGAGIVQEVGKAVTRFKPGDRVTTLFKSRWLAGSMRPEWEGAEFGGPLDGVMREFGAFDAYSLVRAPSHLNSLQAATLPIAALTAWQALEQARITNGQTVLLLGTGGVSIFALQFAKLRGAKVILLSSSDEKLARGKALGADLGINYTKTPQWGAAVREATRNIGVDAVIETVGGSSFAQSIEAVRMHGFVGVVGFLGGFDTQLQLAPVVLKRLRVQGISVASLEQHERMLDAIETARLEPVLDQVFGFEQLPAAFEHVQAGRHFGKIGIDFAL
ncbi:zinc-dependent alcohol dehydrogenase family protein [Dyella mobilis]|uniref:NAD(P)-dependent alcohol dehydrogenase n=1 Tax=Dyella mobilis TaxID=1849582 RepID=A0ABS2KGU5_9GAMM|nr:NAD(P)-dependent alcohol dehydrogenase [Dyella mobilis]MBM7130319.1 NAD(P)-dependent alcohol dehydrogenase [Dyella mobilis]GLQ96945.1 NADPH:quinone oxidoreductase [Dyella mobilis]